MPCLSGFELYSRWVPLLIHSSSKFGSSHEKFDVFGPGLGVLRSGLFLPTAMA